MGLIGVYWKCVHHYQERSIMDIGLFKTFGEALAIGFLIGIERYKDRSQGEKKSAGLRTFTIFSLIGAVCGILPVVYTLMTLGALIVFLSLGYYRRSVNGFGLTTEVAAILTFWLGYLMHEYEMLAISTGIVLVILLASKRGLHDFVRNKMSEIELYDTLKFLAVVFVVFPLLPDRNMGPYDFFNPTQVWMLIILVSTISYLGYVLTRVLGNERGLMMSALIGGVVSTTAVTMFLADRVKRAPLQSRICGVTGVMANAVQFPRLLLLIWVVDTQLGMLLTIPLLGMGAVGILGAWVLGRKHLVHAVKDTHELPLQNPYSLRPALKFGLFFVGVFLLSKVATVHLGEQGIYLTSAIAGLGDASAIALSTAQMVNNGGLSVFAACGAIFIAVTMNALFKWGLAFMNGNRDLAFWLGGGFVTMLVTGGVLMGVVTSF